MNSKLYYLTLFGESPSDASIGSFTNNSYDEYDEVTCISFSVEILNWIKCCVSLTESLKVPSIREALLQFASVIRELTNQMEGDKEMKIIETIMSSKEILQSAIAIQNALPQIKAQIMKDFFAVYTKNLKKKALILSVQTKKALMSII